MEPVNRRDFLQMAGGLVVLAMIPSCGDEKPDTTCDGAGSTSSTTSGHTHFVCVSLSDLDSPPADGVTLTSSNYEGHTHTVTLGRDQLATIAGGGTVTVISSSSSGHTHSFDIQKGSTQTPSTSGGGY